MQLRYTNLSSIEPHPDYPLKMYYADEVDARIAELEKQLGIAADALRKAGYVGTADALSKSLMVTESGEKHG